MRSRCHPVLVKSFCRPRYYNTQVLSSIHCYLYITYLEKQELLSLLNQKSAGYLTVVIYYRLFSGVFPNFHCESQCIAVRTCFVYSRREYLWLRPSISLSINDFINPSCQSMWPINCSLLLFSCHKKLQIFRQLFPPTYILHPSLSQSMK